MNSVYQCTVPAALRVEQLGRLDYLRRLAARGRLRAAIGWIENFSARASRWSSRPPPRGPALDAVVQALCGWPGGALPVAA